MAVKFDPPSDPYSTLECPHCDFTGPHSRASGVGGEWTFQCARCMGMFTDRPRGTPPSTWLPKP